MINFISKKDTKYPKLLSKIPQPPENIYYRGLYDESIFENCLAVVGCRTSTEYGKRITKKLVTEIASQGITIVSGFMYGIDSFAHQACVEVGGRTIAVLPYGIDSQIPSYQKKLCKDILDNNGLIISEYSGITPPQKWTFVERNRVVAGLSKAVLIVEGARTSGTMVTAALAQKFGKKLFAVSGHLDVLVSQGVNDLIKEGKAEMVASAKDILKVFEKSIKPSKDKATKLSKFEKHVIEVLKNGPMSADEIVLLTKTAQTQVSITLTTLVLSGYINEAGGKFYVS